METDERHRTNPPESLRLLQRYNCRVRHARGQISGNEAQGKENRPPRLQNGWSYPLGTPALDHNRTTALGSRYTGDAVSETIRPRSVRRDNRHPYSGAILIN